MKKKPLAREPITLREKELKNGRRSLYLDYYNGGSRNHSHSYEFLHLYLVPEVDAAAKRKNAATLQAAKAIHAQRIIERANGKAGIKNSMRITIGDWIDIYLQRKRQKVAQNTAARYDIVAALIKDYDGSRMLTDVDKSYALGFAAYLAKRKNAHGGGTLSPNTRSLYFTAFTTILKAAYSADMMPTDIVGRLTAEDREPVKKIATQREYLTAEEVKMLTDTDCASMVRLPFLFACYCGLRSSDLRRLRWRDIVTDGEQVRVHIKMQKTQDYIYLPLNKQAQRYLPQRGADNALVFSRMPNQYALNCSVHAWAAAAGIKKHVTFHTSRHTFATLLLTAGADLYTTSKLLGHRDISVTQVYADIIDKKKTEAVSLLDNMQ